VSDRNPSCLTESACKAGVLLLLLLVGTLAGAHPEYDEVDRTLHDGAGRRLQLVRHYVDGIIAGDPCKIVLRDEAGTVLGETEFARSISVVCWSNSDCLVFRSDSFMPILPDEVFRVHAGRLERASVWWRPLGIAADLLDHWLGYLAMLAVFFLPIAGFQGAMRSKPGVVRNLRLTISVLGGGLILLLWFYAAVVLTPLSFPMLTVLISLTLIADRWWNRRKRTQVT
jgi:hypothetical protein